MDKEQDIIEILKQYKQEHIINLLNKLEEKQKEKLIEQINNIDFHQIMELYENTKKEIEIKENKIESVAYLDKEKLTKSDKERFDEIRRKSYCKWSICSCNDGWRPRYKTWTYRTKRNF